MKIYFSFTILLIVYFASHSPSIAQLKSCSAIDYFEVKIPVADKNPAVTALTTAYPDIKIDVQGDKILIGDTKVVALGRVRSIDFSEILKSATVMEQFLFPYPLEFDPEIRKTSYYDPGRFRNTELFNGLYFPEKKEVRGTLASIPLTGFSKSKFQLTQKRGVDCQFKAAMEVLRSSAVDYQQYFQFMGGSFNWRTIAGTKRMSVHSYGIAFDLNTKLGGYWRWSGAKPGEVGDYENRFPIELIAAFERYGFIWGGKWHHFDGMHFEYRPELILHSRILNEISRGSTAN